jgi:hypothetical protein
MNVFIKNNKFCIIKRNNLYEIDELYNFRGNFIITQEIKDEKTFKHIINLSNYGSNIEYLHCVYYDEIEKEYQNLKKNIYMKIMNKI